MNEGRLDLLIIGAGPAGLSAADAAAREGLDYLVVEKGLIADTVPTTPSGSQSSLRPTSLSFASAKPPPPREAQQRRASLLLRRSRSNTPCASTPKRPSRGLSRLSPEGFRVTTLPYYDASRLLSARARWPARRHSGSRRRAPKVQHRFVEPFPYVREEVLVIGGGNSAAEAALFLSEGGARNLRCLAFGLEPATRRGAASSAGCASLLSESLSRGVSAFPFSEVDGMKSRRC